MNDLIDKNAVATGIVTKIAEDGISCFWNKVKKYFKDIDTQENIDLGLAYEAYLLRTKEKYGKIKTLIYKRIKEELYSFYVHTKLKYGNKELDSSDINNIIELTNKIIITGTGGIGKSTLMHHLFLNTIEKTNYIPVLIELRSLNTIDNYVSIRTFIYEALTNNGFNLEDEYFEYSLNEGGYIFLFDGYDEINKNIADKATKDIQDFADKYHKNHYIVSSRPSQTFIGWNDFDELLTMPLSKEQAIELIDKIKYDETVKNKFLKELDSTLFDKHKSFAQNPLLLTIMLLTYESNAKIPETLNDFYERAFHVLFSEHDAIKDVYERETHASLSYDKFKRVFSYICFISYFENVYEFTDVSLIKYLNRAQNKFKDIVFNADDYQDDLLQHVCMLVKDGLSYRFTHRSFQEYFAAVYTCQLTDEQQKSLFENRLTKYAIDVESYYKMLFDMQNERFIKNILLPGLSKLKKEYEGKQSFSKIITLIYDEFYIKTTSNNGLDWGVSREIDKDDDFYFYNIISLSLNIFNYSRKSRTEETKNAQKKLIRRILNENYNDIVPLRKYHIDFNVLNNLDNSEVELIFDWIKNEHLFVMSLLDKYSDIPSEGTSLSDLIARL